MLAEMQAQVSVDGILHCVVPGTDCYLFLHLKSLFLGYSINW